MAEPARRPKVYIVLYSLYHHIYKLSLSIREGLEAKGIDVQVFQAEETLSDDVLEKMHAPAKPDLPTIQPSQLAEPDGLFFGIPTRFGIFPAQLKALLDATGTLWAKGSLAGKFVGTFFATASQHGGQETTSLAACTLFAHHGMIFVPFGFANAAMFNNDEVIGGSAYGAGTITNGDGSRQPSKTELAIARNQAENYADILNQYHRGKCSTAAEAQKSAAATTATGAPAAAGGGGGGGAVAAGAGAGAAAGAAAGAGLAAGSKAQGAASATTGTGAAGADSDASIRSLKAASSQQNAGGGNDKDTPVITTTSPEGQTERPADGTGATPAGEPAAGAGPTDTSAAAAGEQPPGAAAKKKKRSKLWRFCCGAQDAE